MQITFDHKESEIMEEDEDEDGEGSPERIDPETQKDSIRKIIARQRSLYLSSSSSDSLSASSSRSFSSSDHRSGRSSSSSLLELMKGGGMSLGRLFDMEHTTLTAHLTDYSASPVTRPLLLRGSCDSRDESPDLRSYWSPVLKSFRKDYCGLSSSVDGQFSEGRAHAEGALAYAKRSFERRRKLTRRRSYRALPRVRLWRFKGFRKLLFRLRRRLKVVICGKVPNNSR